MPNMNGAEAYHSILIAKNKMFVIGVRTNNKEVFDNNSSKIVFLESFEVLSNFFFHRKVSYKSKMIVGGKKSSMTFCYDTYKEKRSTI